jgi:hypothetical protein
MPSWPSATLASRTDGSTALAFGSVMLRGFLGTGVEEDLGHTDVEEAASTRPGGGMSFVTQNVDRPVQFAHRSSLFRRNTVVMGLVLDRGRGSDHPGVSFSERRELCQSR